MSLNQSLLGFPKTTEGPARLVLGCSGLSAGSVATKIRVLTGVVIYEDAGVAEYVSDATNGDYYEIKQSGMYTLQYNERGTGNNYIVWCKNLPSQFWAANPDANLAGSGRPEYVPTLLNSPIRTAATLANTIVAVCWLNQGDQLKINTNDGGTYTPADTIVIIERHPGY